jgi:hypothetical protein
MKAAAAAVNADVRSKGEGAVFAAFFTKILPSRV